MPHINLKREKQQSVDGQEQSRHCHQDQNLNRKRDMNIKPVVDSVSDPYPHKQMPPGSAWTDSDPDPGGKYLSLENVSSLGEYRTGRLKVRILL